MRVRDSSDDPFREIARNDDVKGVLLRSSLPKTFSAGLLGEEMEEEKERKREREKEEMRC